MQPTQYGGIEAGGTKFFCIVADGPQNILAEKRIPTTTPGETLEKAAAFFEEQAKTHKLAGLGIASFGPLDLEPGSPTFGYITHTPKAGWSNTNLAGFLKKRLGLPVAIDTDVNGAALAEHLWGAGQGIDPLVYLTIGTGIGGGAIYRGQPLGGLLHPEMGHLLLPHDPDRDPFPGICPFHGDCFEGLASGPAIQARWGAPAELLPPDHPAWDLEAFYIAAALSAYIGILSPRRIILGGGVSQAPGLLDRIRIELLRLANGYYHSPTLLNQIETYLVAPGLGSYAGSLGALALAQRMQFDHFAR